MPAAVALNPHRPTGPLVGLTSAEARRRLTEFGVNEIRREQAIGVLKLLGRQFTSPVIWLLVAASAVSAGLGELPDALAIGTIVIVNGAIGFFQEHRAERAVLALRSMTAPRARVLRDGHSVMVPAGTVVPGDVLVLEAGDVAATHRRVLSQCLIEAPYQEIEASDVMVPTGRVSEMIQREALRQGAALIVMGSRGRGGLSRLVLGSSGAALMRTARTPVLLVPSTDIDIVSIGDTAALTCGAVLAAVDLEEACEHQLRMAARMAKLAHGPLMLMTVARARMSEHDAGQRLRERAHELAITPHALIVRRGDVAIQIS